MRMRMRRVVTGNLQTNPPGMMAQAGTGWHRMELAATWGRFLRAHAATTQQHTHTTQNTHQNTGNVTKYR
jgi:hypothetical protein